MSFSILCRILLPTLFSIGLNATATNGNATLVQFIMEESISNNTEIKNFSRKNIFLPNVTFETHLISDKMRDDVDQTCEKFRSTASHSAPDVISFKGWMIFYKGTATLDSYVWHSSPNDSTPFYETDRITARFDKTVDTSEKINFFSKCRLVAEELDGEYYSLQSPGLNSVSAAIALQESGWFEVVYPNFRTVPSKP